MKMTGFTPYSPEVKSFGEGVQYFCDDKGRDFYDSRDLFTKKYVVFFDDFSIVRAVVKSADITHVNPTGLSAVDINSLPKDLDIFTGLWKFDGRKVVEVDFDPSISTERRKASAMTRISTEIVPLQDAVELGVASKEESAKYDELRKLRIKLLRISDDTPAKDVDWEEFKPT